MGPVIGHGPAGRRVDEPPRAHEGAEGGGGGRCRFRVCFSGTERVLEAIEG